MLRGVVIGLVGAALWIGGLMLGLTQFSWFWLNHCPPVSVSPDCANQILLPILIGPITGVMFSMILSGLVEWVFRTWDVTDRRVIFAISAATYLTLLCSFAFIGRSARVHTSSGLIERVGFAFAMCGIDWAGPAPLVCWAVLAGLLHAGFRRADRRRSN